MIIDRQYFDLQNRCVVEKLVIKTPVRFATFFHDEACFIYTRAGETSITSPTEKVDIHTEESVMLKCGNYFAELNQKSVLNGACEIFVIHLYSEILKEIYQDEIPSFVLENQKRYYVQKIAKHSILNHFIESIDFYFKNPSLVNPDLLKLKLKELILLLLQTGKAKTVLSLFSHLFAPRKASLFEMIQNHLFTNISVKDLAKLSGRSLSSFKREFENHFESPPAKYIRERKLEKALDLIKATDSTISEICYQVGFTDTPHFTRAFKQKYRHSPSFFRNNSVEDTLD